MIRFTEGKDIVRADVNINFTSTITTNRKDLNTALIELVIEALEDELKQAKELLDE